MIAKNSAAASGIYNQSREKYANRNISPCSKCGGHQEIGLDPDAGIYKSCLNCGSIEYAARGVKN